MWHMTDQAGQVAGPSCKSCVEVGPPHLQGCSFSAVPVDRYSRVALISAMPLTHLPPVAVSKGIAFPR